jgi:type I restriction enzyme S subunit
MINMGELFANDRIGDIEMERVQLDERELENSLVTLGDLLFARQSLVLSGAGKCSIVVDAPEPTTFESHLIRVRLKSGIADPRFYHYFFRSPASPMRSIVTQGVQAGIRANDLKRLVVPCPPLSDQQRIADVLSAYDDLVQNNRRRIALLEQSARLLYREWFLHLRFPGHEQVKVVDGVPEGWEKRKLEEISNEIRVAVAPEKVASGTPYIGLEHMPRRSITLSDWGHSEDITSQKFAYMAGDILFGKIRPYFHKVGFTLTDGITSSDAIVIRPSDHNHYYFLLLLVSSDQFVALASQTVKEGSKMPRADWKFLRKQEFAVPPDGLLRELSAVCGPITDQLKALASANEKLRQARDLLLPRLMSGHLVV